MSKTLVIVGEGERVPFLRGILTRSIQDTGLAFDDAYGLATAIRDDLRDVAEVSTVELRERVVARLRPLGNGLVERYLRPEMPTILVRAPSGVATPYSRSRHRLRLEACGFGPMEATELAGVIQERLTTQGMDEVTSMDLRRLTFEHLSDAHGDRAARRFLVWEEFQDSGDPLLILLGGATGSGKSTIASHVAHQLEIVRTQPTDMLREVMRMMIPAGLLPVLHTSTFMAHTELPSSDGANEDGGARLANGYLTQSRLLTAACGVVAERALCERVSLILEGIHVHPEWMSSVVQETSGAIVAPIMLAVLRPEELRARLQGRSREAPDRRARRYLEHFDEIWRLQSFLLSEADRCGVPIIPNVDPDRTARQILGSVLRVLAQRFDGAPERVLAD